MPSPVPIVKIIRPKLSADERAARMEELKKATAAFMAEVEKSKRTKG